ncbi:hypothetical protein BD410DRAFT_843007 [Rickenella mellea]|uniref:Uncharacterized protein n=1 Tax=Rickenella mellea TaxID=50990 RepID=A0A4Y7PTU6_9AGAM|nr:hypothetical protein BD410DRAFT_843007 [Rickenella mellea]
MPRPYSAEKGVSDDGTSKDLFVHLRDPREGDKRVAKGSADGMGGKIIKTSFGKDEDTSIKRPHDNLNNSIVAFTASLRCVEIDAVINPHSGLYVGWRIFVAGIELLNVVVGKEGISGRMRGAWQDCGASGLDQPFSELARRNLRPDSSKYRTDERKCGYINAKSRWSQNTGAIDRVNEGGGVDDVLRCEAG